METGKIWWDYECNYFCWNKQDNFRIEFGEKIIPWEAIMCGLVN